MKGPEDMLRKEIPSKDEFYNSLGTGTSISSADYEHSLKVWSVFNCRNMASYTKLYCHLDTLLLAEAFREFSHNCFNTFHLYPEHFVTLPGLYSLSVR